MVVGETWDYLQHLQYGTDTFHVFAVLSNGAKSTARRRWRELAAALVAKGAAETVEGVCRQSIICERIGDARHRPCAEASSVPLDYLAQAQVTL